MSVASEDSLRAQQARQEAGLSGLTGALTSRLGGVNTQYQATLGGIGNLYNTIAQGAQSAGGSAVAAAGGAPLVMTPAGGNPMLASTLANLGAQTVGYAPAAEITGQQLIGASKSNLAKALTDRANTLSSDTAKYLLQLQGTEYDKAVAQTTAEQNAKRLGISADTAAADIAYKTDTSNLRWAELDRKRAADAAKAGTTGIKAVAAVQKSILGDAASYVKPQNTGLRDYKIIWTQGGKKFSETVPARSAKGAAWQLRTIMPQGTYRKNTYKAIDSGISTSGAQLPKRSTVEQNIRGQLMNAGATQVEADAWLNTYAGAIGLNTLPA